MKSRLLLLLIIPLGFYGCGTSNETSSESNDAPLNVKGSWELVSYIPHSDGGTEWTSHGDSILYQKHLTDNHFVWFNYDKKNNQMLGMGGGSYKLKDGKYVEDIKFFYPPGSSELGQAIPFDYELEKDMWYHTGYAKQMEMDVETMEMVVLDSNKIEEKWVKTSVEPATNDNLVGTWDLASYREQLETSYTEYPEFVGKMKLLTPTHFTWIHFDKEGDEIFAAGSGRYTFEGDTYTETIDMIFPTNTGVLNESVSFTATIDSIKWKHFGYIPQVSIDSTSGNIVRDSALIDEIWRAHYDME